MDKRRNNGNTGHSTKARAGTIDKRKNQYRKALEEACTKEDVIEVIRMVKNKAIQKQDVKAAQLFLEYYVGKPKESLDVTTDGEMINIPIIQFKKSNE